MPLVGTINSRFRDNDAFELPPNSLYTPIDETIAGWAGGELKPKGQPAETFAEMVVGNIVGTSSGEWVGLEGRPCW